MRGRLYRKLLRHGSTNPRTVIRVKREIRRRRDSAEGHFIAVGWLGFAQALELARDLRRWT
jgi:hypothetical protein